MPAPPETALSFDRSLFVPGLRVTVALSGGADSTALLRVLHAWNALPREALGIGLSAIHIHHGIRGEAADRDQAFVQQLCAGLAVPLHVKAVKTPEYAAESRETLEEAARSLRYAAFTERIAANEADAVATAHTADDQAETVLMKLLRGAWTEGLAGIFPVKEVKAQNGRAGRILRPLLSTDRAAVEGYLRSLDQSWIEDETNQDQTFTRNHLRHHVLPLLRGINPSLNGTLCNLAELARDEESYWQQELERVLPGIVLPGKPVRGGGRANSTSPGDAVYALDIERLRVVPRAMQRRLLRRVARLLGTAISFPETMRLLALAGLAPPLPNVPSKPGGSLVLADGLVADRSLREIRLSRSAVPERPPAPASAASA